MMRANVLAILLAFSGFACEGRALDDEVRTLTGGEPVRGKELIGRYGCGACHDIPGVTGARGTVGPPLSGIANRGYLAGQLSNSPDNMRRWIQQPQHVERGTAMPDMGVTDEHARDITAYLYTLR